MCGFIGIGGPAGRDLVDQRLDDLAHRGPDDRGIWTTPELTLGHRRLAIIGLDSDGRQPRMSHSGRSVLVFNGEIYNYLEIADKLESQGRTVDRRFDTSVLLEALEVWGCDCLPDLNGMFAFAWYRTHEKRLILARDRWGKKPLFWGRPALGDGQKTLVFSSELGVFRRLPGGPPSPSPLGVARYLVYDGMPDEVTVYEGVYKVPAATWLELDTKGHRLRQTKYWSFSPHPELLTEDDAVDRAHEAIGRAIKLRLRSDVPVGLFLSGGLDSSTLAMLWRELCPTETIRTFTIGFEDRSYDERESAREVAKSIDADHTEHVLSGRQIIDEFEFVFEHMSEPLADPSIIPTSCLARLARQKVVVGLSGDGGDELQAGYDPFRAWMPARALESLFPRKVLVSAFRGIESLLPTSPDNLSARFKARHFGQGFLGPQEERIQNWLASFPVHAALKVMDPSLAAEVDFAEVLEPTRRAFRAVESSGPLFSQVNTWIETYLESSILTKVDRASMLHSLETRSPLLDPQVAAALTDVPPALLFSRGKGKRLLRSLAARNLPGSIVRKPKKGFGVPQATWLRTVLRDRMEAVLLDMNQGGWFDQQVVAGLWNDHLCFANDHRKSLWSILMASPFQR